MRISVDIDQPAGTVSIEIAGAWTVEARQDSVGALAAVCRGDRLEHLIACPRTGDRARWNFDGLTMLSIPSPVKSAVRRAVRRLH